MHVISPYQKVVRWLAPVVQHVHKTKFIVGDAMEQSPEGWRWLAGGEQQQAVPTQSAAAADSPHEQQPEHTP